MLKDKLIRNEKDGKRLIEILKEKHRDIYENLYKEEKKMFLECVLENEQEPLIKYINKQIYKKELDEKFYNANEVEIIRLVDEELSDDNLMKEYELYIKKTTLIDNHHELDYIEIMMIEIDEDKEIYDRDFMINMKVIKSLRNLYLYGHAGNGKTTFAYNVAKELKVKLFNINSVKNEFSVKGFFNMDGSYQLSLYETWYRDGGVLLLDEVDSYSSNGMLYLNNGVEVNSKYMTLENGDVIHKHKDCYVIACANTDGTGKTADFIGRNAIDKAFMSRFTKKEYKEYAYIHKLIVGKENYEKFKGFLDSLNVELTTRLWVKIKGLLNMFDEKELKDLIRNKEIEL